MPQLIDLSSGLPGDDDSTRIRQMSKELSEWGRLLSNERKLEIASSGTLTMTTSGSASQVETVAHGLNFSPIIVAYLNSTTVSIGGNVLTTTANVSLPNYISATIDTTDDRVYFRSYMFVATDEENIYFILANSGETAGVDIPLKYFLLKETAAQAEN